MAITDVAAYAHLSHADLQAFGAELDAIRRDIEGARGENDRAYIRRTIAFQRFLEIAARLAIAGTGGKVGWGLGVTALAVAKSIENMELGHNIGHGQWDWMNDPEIHSTEWELKSFVREKNIRLKRENRFLILNSMKSRLIPMITC